MAVILKMNKYILCYLILSQVTAEPPGIKLNYTELIRLSLLFYEAQRSGKLPTTNKIPWRGDSGLTDKGDNGEDLTGGYYDAVDFVKQGFFIAYTITMLSWGLIAFKEGYRSTGQYNSTMDAVKWGTDYLIKCHVAPDVFYAQVGTFSVDREYWGRPEEMNMSRTTYKIDKDNPGTDIAAETAAALAASSIIFKETNITYSQILLKHSEQLFELARKYEGLFQDSYPRTRSQYEYEYENKDFGDELAWAAIWLYRATKKSEYEKSSIEYYDKYKMYLRPKSFFYNTKTAGVQLIMAQEYGSVKYVEDATIFCNYAIHKEMRTPRGLVYIQKAGTLAHAANIAFICLQVGKLSHRSKEYIYFAKQQLDYIVGTNGGSSYLVGYGHDYPKQPHHASSSCRDRFPFCYKESLPEPHNITVKRPGNRYHFSVSIPYPSPACSKLDSFEQPCNKNDYYLKTPNPQILYGALVSGPDPVDQYKDMRQYYLYGEVSIDFNAGFQGLLAGLSYQEDYFF